MDNAPSQPRQVWPHGDYPLIDVGVMELNRNPENYFTEVEPAAFSPSNIVRGIGFSSIPAGAVFIDIVRQRAKVDP